MPRPYSVQCSFAAYFITDVTVEGDNLEDALAKAIEAANATDNWRSTDHCGPTFVETACEGEDDDPGRSPNSIEVPERFSENGGLPVVSIGDPRDPNSGIRVKRGRVLLQFDYAEGRVTAETPALPNDRPLITIRPRHDGAPDVTITEGNARIRILGYDRT